MIEPHSAIARLADCSTPENEYWTHVSRQDELPLAKGSARLKSVADLNALADEYAASAPADLVTFIADRLLVKPGLINEIRVLCGITDKRMYLDLSYIFTRIEDPDDTSKTLSGEPPHMLTKHPLDFFQRKLAARQGRPLASTLSATTIAAYLVDKGIARMLHLYAHMQPADRGVLINNLIMPKELQQNETKRRGHGAEAAVAVILRDLGVHFSPFDKIENPMGSNDPNVSPDTFEVLRRVANKTLSVDLLMLDSTKIVRGCMQGLIQSSDPGQFGVNKSDETLQIRCNVDAFNAAHIDRQIQYWGLVDGVGYCENKTGTLNKMLRHFHRFVQIKSLYKVGLGMHEMGLCTVRGIHFNPGFYSRLMRAQMIDKYVSRDIPVIDDPGDVGSLHPIAGGHATLFI